MKIYGDTNSGNCLKVKWVCDHLAPPLPRSLKICVQLLSYMIHS